MRFLTPGPTQLHPRMPEFIQDALSNQIGSISHRSSAFEKIYASMSAGLLKMLGAPDGTHVFLLGSATEAMERLVENCSAKHTFHFVNGAFSERFLQIAQELDRAAVELRVAPGAGFSFDAVAIPKESELICVTHNETSTGVMLDPSDFRALKQRYPKKILAVDIVSSAPYPELPWDVVDAAFFSVQKCFGLPAGLGVLLVNDSCMEKSADILRSGRSVGSYHSFPSLFSSAQKWQTPETPNVLLLYLLGRVIEDFLATDMTQLRRELAERSALLYSFLDQSKTHRAFVTDTKVRSTTVITAEVASASSLLKKLEAQGMQVGSGYGPFKDKHIRIANFPSHSRADIEKVIQLLSAA